MNGIVNNNKKIANSKEVNSVRKYYNIYLAVFWIFCGTVILLYVIGVFCITAPIAAIASIFNNGDKEEKKIK